MKLVKRALALLSMAQLTAIPLVQADQAQDTTTVQTQSQSQAQPQSAIVNQVPAPAQAADAKDQPVSNWSAFGQVTVVNQFHGSFPSQYSGAESLENTHEFLSTVTSTLYLGYRLNKTTEIFINPETNWGKGFSDAFGMGAFNNGEVNRAGGSGLIYKVNRFFIVETIPLGSDTTYQEEDHNQLAGYVPDKYFRVSVGQFSNTDYFDRNDYANDAREGFLNWCFMNNCSYDFAQNPLGYIQGAVAELGLKDWQFRAGFTAQIKSLENFDYAPLSKAHGSTYEVEHDHTIGKLPGAVRVLYFDNIDKEPTFNQATQQLQEGISPNVYDPNAAIPYTHHRGVGLNLQQQVSDNVGVFMRFGKNDGKSPNYGFTDVDATQTAGLYLNGKMWKKPDDTFGVAAGQNELSHDHIVAQQNGYNGIMLGDGNLNYGKEQFLEAYYAHTVIDARCGALTVTPDVQMVKNPGFNTVRGPVKIAQLRFHWQGNLKKCIKR